MDGISAAMKPVGSVSVADLYGVCQLEGLENLPYPFFTRSWPRRGMHATASLSDRLADGDLRHIRPWMEIYTSADIWVECQVHYSSPDIPAVRIAACATNWSCFLAMQRPKEEIVDVFLVWTPHELGSALARLAGLSNPGRHSRIVGPPFFTELHETNAYATYDADDGLLLSVTAPPRTGRVVPKSDVAAMGVIQSRCDPAQDLQLRKGGSAVGWVHVRDDGDYVYTADFSHAAPVTVQNLGNRIDKMIALDLATLRQRDDLY